MLTSSDVVNADDPAATFADFAQQVLGAPFATVDDLRILRGKAKELFKKHPGTSWDHLCAVVYWAKRRKRRPDRVWKIVDMFRYAWADGALGHLESDSADLHLESQIRDALAVEEDPEWRQRLLVAKGSARRDVLRDWLTERAELT